MHSLGVSLNDATKKLEIEKVDFPAVRAYRRGSWAVPDERKDHHESPSRISTITKLWAECSQLAHHGNLGKTQT